MRQSTTSRTAQVTTLLLLALGSFACARSVEEWESDLASPWTDDFHRGMAAITLAEQAPERAQGAVMPLLSLLDGPEGPMRPHAAEALRKIAPWSVEEMVRTLVHSTYFSEDCRLSLEAAIVSAGDRAMSPLLAAMREPDRLDAGQIGPILRKIGDPAVDPLLEIVREYPGSPMATHAMWALGQCGPVARRALPMLLDALRGENADVSVTAAASLGRIDPGGGTVLPALRESLADPRHSVRIEAARSIAHVCVVRASAAKGAEREAALREVVRLGEPIHPSLFDQIASGGPKRERAARDCLLAIAARWTVLPPSARLSSPPLPRLQASLDDEDSAVRSSATFDLGRMGAPAAPALPRLARALEDRDRSVRTGAALAIAVIAIDLARARISRAGTPSAASTDR